jgi:hypothetical protein
MADQTRIKWLYPPNFEGTYPAGTKNGNKRHIILCTNYSDGTGEDDAIKLKRTDLITPSGNVPSKLAIEKIKYSIAGMTVRISYNNANDEEVAVLYDGEDEIDFTPSGGFVPESDGDLDAGDIVFTTQNNTAGDSYNIILTVRPKD